MGVVGHGYDSRSRIELGRGFSRARGEEIYSPAVWR